MTILLIIVIDNIDKKDYHTHGQINKEKKNVYQP